MVPKNLMPNTISCDPHTAPGKAGSSSTFIRAYLKLREVYITLQLMKLRLRLSKVTWLLLPGPVLHLLDHNCHGIGIFRFIAQLIKGGRMNLILKSDFLRVFGACDRFWYVFAQYILTTSGK